MGDGVHNSNSQGCCARVLGLHYLRGPLACCHSLQIDTHCQLVPTLSITAGFVQAYYDAIKSEPFQYHQGTDEMSEMFFNPDHKGWLVKEGMVVLSTPVSYCVQYNN